MASKPNLYGLGISILSSHIDMGPSLEDLRKDTSGTEDLLCDEEQNQARGAKCKPNGHVATSCYITERNQEQNNGN